MEWKRSEPKAAQARLQVIYERELPGLVEALADFESHDLSCPQLLDISAHAYGAADVRLLIVGKQTEGWHEDWKDVKACPPAVAVRELLRTYGEFKLAVNDERKRNSPFWRYSHNLYQLVNPSGPDCGFLWSNLIKMAEKKKKWEHPVWPIEERISKTFDVLISEVELATPDVVVFFSGHSYDECIKRSFPGAQLLPLPLSGFDSKWLSIVRHDRLPKHSYRTYHPGYLNRQPNGDEVLKKIRNLVSRK